MSGEETTEMKKMTLSSIKKRIVPFDEDNPAIEPLFINYAHAVVVGGSYYVDVGVITLESFSAENESRIGDFAVIHRLVMSKETLVIMRDQLTNILEHEQGNKTDASTPDGT
jgi:hypothetical protein